MSNPLKLTLEALAGHDLSELEAAPFVVEDHKVRLDCRLKLHPGTDRLFIMLNGAVDRKKTPLPVFARWNWGRVLGGHVLAVCDPTLYLDEELNIGWFVGRRHWNPLDALLRTVATVRERLNISGDRSIYYGSSGGGFAALCASSREPGGRALVINPQTEIVQYYGRFVTRIAKVFDPQQTAQQLRTEFPLRWSAIAAVQNARAAHRAPRVFYAQNVTDAWHHKHHFLPFCARLGLPSDGGLSTDGSMMTHTYASAEGHGAEPPELVKHVCAVAVPFLIDEVSRAANAA